MMMLSEGDMLAITKSLVYSDCSERNMNLVEAIRPTPVDKVWELLLLRYYVTLGLYGVGKYQTIENSISNISNKL